MADDKKRRKRTKRTGTSTKGSGRATPSPRATGRVTEPVSSRYTPPIPPEFRQSSKLVPIFMFGFFFLGVAIILLNYLPGAPILPGDTSNWYLLGGLGLICLGFGAATRYR